MKSFFNLAVYDEWQERALCASTGDPDMHLRFFDGHNEEYARRMCQMCPVQPECLEYAVETGQMAGIWGGLNEKERIKLRRKKPHLRDKFVKDILEGNKNGRLQA